MSNKKYNGSNKQLEEEFAEEKDIIEAQKSVHNNPKSLYLKSCKFSDIHNMIKKARLVNGYTQHRLSAAIGINRSTYSRYENGERQIPSKVLDDILEELNLFVIIEANKKDRD